MEYFSQTLLTTICEGDILVVKMRVVGEPTKQVRHTKRCGESDEVFISPALLAIFLFPTL